MKFVYWVIIAIAMIAITTGSLIDVKVLFLIWHSFLLHTLFWERQRR